MKKFVCLLCAIVMVLSLFPMATFAVADTRRPVYIMKHKCNDVEAIQSAFNAGCNAMEIDLRCDDPEDQTRNIYDASGKFVYEDCFFLAHNDAFASSDVSIHEFFQQPAMHSEQISLVVFDIKTPEYMKLLNEAVHDCYDRYYSSADPVPYIIYSVAEMKETKYLGSDYLTLNDNEGVCVDYENDASAIEARFKELGRDRCWYGNGIFSGEDKDTIINGCKAAANIRDFVSNSSIKKVESWTVHSVGELQKRIVDWRCDSVMIDFNPSSYGGVNYIMSQSIFSSVRLATRSDSPFEKWEYKYVPGEIISFSDYDNGFYNISNLTFTGDPDEPIFYINHNNGILSISFENCVFKDCGNRSTDGSCIYINNVTSLDSIYFYNCVAYNCKGDYGAFMYINDHDAKVYGNGTTIISNCSADEGGAIAIDEAAEVSGFVMTDNRVDSYGGAISNRAKNYSNVVKDCIFANNSAGEEGGGVWNSWEAGTVVSSKFFNNSADEGSDIDCDSSSSLVRDCVVYSTNSSPIHKGNQVNCRVVNTRNLTLTKGYGTSDNPYRIENEEDWVAFACMVKNGNGLTGKYVRLDNDIMIWDRVGTKSTSYFIPSNYFYGYFDGNGHKLKSASAVTDMAEYVLAANNQANISNMVLVPLMGNVEIPEKSNGKDNSGGMSIHVGYENDPIITPPVPGSLAEASVQQDPVVPTSPNTEEPKEGSALDEFEEAVTPAKNEQEGETPTLQINENKPKEEIIIQQAQNNEPKEEIPVENTSKEASVLSEGSLLIAGGIGVAAVATVAGLVIFKKKR